MTELGRAWRVALLSWLAMVGFDFFLHGGLLSSLYLRPSPFLLPLAEAFRRIPLGYLSFALLSALLIWLMLRLGVEGARRGMIFGALLGALIWGAFVLGLLSIATADADLLVGWFVGQTLELGIGGVVSGAGLANAKLKPLLGKVLVFVLACVVATVALQSLGVVPVARL